MSKIKEIEEAVSQLAPSQLAQFRAWFAKYDSNAWDEQIEADAQSGKLDALADAAIEAHRRGETEEI